MHQRPRRPLVCGALVILTLDSQFRKDLLATQVVGQQRRGQLDAEKVGAIPRKLIRITAGKTFFEHLKSDTVNSDPRAKRPASHTPRPKNFRSTDRERCSLDLQGPNVGLVAAVGSKFETSGNWRGSVRELTSRSIHEKKAKRSSLETKRFETGAFAKKRAAIALFVIRILQPGKILGGFRKRQRISTEFRCPSTLSLLIREKLELPSKTISTTSPPSAIPN